MLKFIERAKYGLEWAQLGKFVADCVLAGASWKAVKKGLSYTPHISPDWASVIALVAAGLMLLGLIRWQQRALKTPQRQIQTQPAATTAPTNEFQNVEEFYKTYDNVLLVETEGNIRKLSDRYQPGSDRERFFIRFIASGVLLFVFELVWANIFRSQIRALEELNKRPHRTEGLRPFYQQAATEHPSVYRKYPFEMWLAFIRAQGLIKDHPLGLEVTVRGREFLKYLIHTGRSATDRMY